MNKITPVTQFVTHNYRHRQVIGSLFCGASLCYSMEQEKYIQIPVILFFPVTYTGYQLYKHKELIKTYFSDKF
jgi:hypothetical protein